MSEYWYLVGVGITLVPLSLAAFVYIGFRWGNLAQADEASYYGCLIPVILSLLWIVSLPVTAAMCIGRIAYLLRHRTRTDKAAR